MKIVLLVAIGVAGGIIGGMGMGGGTLLIPLLVVLADIGQHGAQAINLAAFIPMSVVALVIHFKNRLVDIKKAAIIAVPATIVSVFSSLLAGRAAEKNLTVYFGIFLLVLGIYQLVAAIVKKVNNCKRKNRDNA